MRGNLFTKTQEPRAESFHQHLYFLTRHFTKHGIILPNDVEWTVPADQKSHISFETLDQLALMGIYYENNDGTTLIKSSKYPLFLKYFSMLCNEAGQKLKVGIFDCVVTCDFRIFTKGFGRKIDDTTRAVSESNKAFILETHNHLISKGIKIRPRGYYDLRYEYKKQVLLDTKLVLLMYLDFRVPLGNRPDDEQYKAIIAEIESQPNKDELLRYIVHNIGCCNFCYGNRAISCGGYHKEFFGEQRHLCGFLPCEL